MQLESTLTIQTQSRKTRTIIAAKNVLSRAAKKRQTSGVRVVLEKFKYKARKFRDSHRIVNGMPLTGDVCVVSRSIPAASVEVAMPVTGDVCDTTEANKITLDGDAKRSAAVLAPSATVAPAEANAPAPAPAPTSVVPADSSTMAALCSESVPPPFVPVTSQPEPAALTPKAESIGYSQQSTVALARDLSSIQLTQLSQSAQTPSTLPCGVFDFDGLNRNNPFEVADYAMDIFNYYKQRETKFTIRAYMEKQDEVTCSVRAQIIDWMARLHECFELNNETLYLAVKVLDIYLSRMVVKKDRLRIIASAALLIAAKFDVSFICLVF